MEARTRRKQAVLSLPLGVALLLAVIPRANAQQFAFQANNLSLSGGDPAFPVASDVTFEDLVLTEMFHDGSTQTVPLLDSDSQPQTSLDTGLIFLQSAPFTNPDPAHGALQSATLTGSFDLTDWDIQTAFGGPVTSATVEPDFTATLNAPAVGDSVNIAGVDVSSGAEYAAGTFGFVSAVPEPGFWAFVASGLAAAGLVRRRCHWKPRR
jgi:MYXO-CTERM domain-containing protein